MLAPDDGAPAESVPDLRVEHEAPDPVPRFTTLADWLDWHAAIHPKRMELGLERVADVWRRLGPEHLPCPVVTVAGTNGKGSCVAMIEAMAIAAGYATASYTSPHLLRYNERVKLSGEPVSDERLCRAFARVEVARGDVALTYFELGTLAALDIIVEEGPELAVLEVGLGGRLDAVNVIDADVAVVTSIGHDHTAWLGETLEEIAVEKAGIFRPGRPALIGQTDAPQALRREAERIGARPIQLGREMQRTPADPGWIFEGVDGKRLALPLPALRGGFQLDNAAAAVGALRVLHGRLPLSVAAIRQGLQRAQLPGRFQVMPGEISWIFDVAHNAEAARALASNLQGFQRSGTLRTVLAVLADKDPEAIVGPLTPFVHDWYLTQSDDPRAMSVERLSECLARALPSERAHACESVESALEAALAASRSGDSILVVGSFTTVGQALRRSSGI